MKAFEVYSWQPKGWPEPHPCVIVSHPTRAQNKDPVEVLMCSTKRATRRPEFHEVILDEADGMDWPTVCKCDLIHTVARQELKNLRGTISTVRQKLLARTVVAAHGWHEVL